MDTFLSGAVIAFAGRQDKIPDGWHECNGASLDRNEYQSLFNAIGTLYGGDGNPKFNLPDYRGYFLRAANANRADAPDCGRGIGTPQNDAIQHHFHTLPGVHLQAQGGAGFDGSGFDSNSNHSGWQGPYASSDVLINPPTHAADETRPKNIAVLYLIKL